MKAKTKRIKNQAITIASLTTVLSGFALVSAFGQFASKAETKVFLQSAPSNVTLFASGLNNPRGLKFGPDGYLYVAEGGIGGMDPACVVVAGVGPYTGNPANSRVSRIVDGIPTPVGDPLPSSQTSVDTGSLVSGVADIAFIGHTLYAILAGAGCSHGVPTIPNEVIRLNGNGSWTRIADLSAYVMAHPVAHPDPDDFEPDGTWYSMIAVHGYLYAVEPNHQEIDRISPVTGAITRVVDISAFFPPPNDTNRNWVGPTALVYRGNFYFGNLGR